MSIFRGIPTHQEDSVALMASFVISRWSPRITIHGLRRMVAANIPRKNYSAISTIFDGKITMFDGKIHYKWSFSIAMLNYQRVFCNNLHPKKTLVPVAFQHSKQFVQTFKVKNIWMSPQTSSLDAAWYFFPVAGMIGCGASKALEQNGNFNQKPDGTIGCGDTKNQGWTPISTWPGWERSHAIWGSIALSSSYIGPRVRGFQSHGTPSHHPF